MGASVSTWQELTPISVSTELSWWSAPGNFRVGVHVSFCRNWFVKRKCWQVPATSHFTFILSLPWCQAGSHGAEGCVFPVLHPVWGCPAASTLLKKQRGTASTIHLGAPLPQFPGSLAVYLQKRRQNWLADCLHCCIWLIQPTCRSHAATEEAGSCYEGWHRKGENVISIILSHFALHTNTNTAAYIPWFFFPFCLTWSISSSMLCWHAGTAEHPWGNGRCHLIVNPFSWKDSLTSSWPWQSLLHWWYFLSIQNCLPVFFVSNRGQVAALRKVIPIRTLVPGNLKGMPPAQVVVVVTCNVGHRKLRNSCSACSLGPFAPLGLA